jgi:hypothetical protein
MSGFELVAGVIAAFFAVGIVAGMLAVIALSTPRGRRGRGGRRRGYDPNQTQPIDWTPPTVPRQPSGPDWEDRPDWTQPPGPDESDDIPPPWPGRRG